jgi:high-affinity Fe2+/Pb2+ permease
MENYSSFAMAIAMVAAFLLVVGGVKLMLARQTRVRGVLMIVAALVLITNVMIWTV